MGKKSGPIPKVNIGGNENDAFHRYKREKIQIKKVQVDNIVNAYAKTTITNMPQICEDIDRPINLITKYFGTELGTQSRFDKKSKSFILNGLHYIDDLEQMLNTFIEVYVLCESCRNPETDVVVSASGDATLECIACGHTTVIPPKNKLVNYIVKNPPKKKDKVKGKARDKQVDDEEQPEHTIAPKIKPQYASKEKIPRHPVAQLRASLGLKVTEDPKNVDLGDEQLKEYVKDVATEFKLDNGDCICLLFDTLVSPENIIDILENRKNLFKNYLKSTKEQRVLLRCVEYLVEDDQETLNLKVGQILKCVYDNLIDDEDIFVDWYEAKKGKKNRKFNVIIAGLAKPFIDWLTNESDEEDETDDDSDEDSDDE